MGLFTQSVLYVYTHKKGGSQETGWIIVVVVVKSLKYEGSSIPYKLYRVLLRFYACIIVLNESLTISLLLP